MKKIILKALIATLLIVALILIYKYQTKDKLFTVMESPSFQLTDQNKQIITEKYMLGKIYVVEFFFANCSTICPIMNQNLKEVSNAIGHPDFGIVSITIDPKRDTPENLKLHAQHLGITNPNWHFLTGDRDYIYQLSKKYNIYMGENENTAEGLNHSGKIALVDKHGNIRSRYENGVPILYYSGLNYKDEKGTEPDLSGTYHPEIEWLKEDIRKLLNEK